MWVCAGSCVYVWVHVCLFIHAIEGHLSPSNAIAQDPISFFYQKDSLSGTWSMSIILDSLARAPPSRPLQLWDSKWHLHTWSTPVLGTKRGSSCCHGRHWAIIPAPQTTALKPNFPLGEIVFGGRQSERVHLSLWAVVEQLNVQKDLGHTWQGQPLHFRVDKLSQTSKNLSLG